jgi:DNA polymerase-3 subunit chi
VPAGYNGFARVIELVSRDGPDRDDARLRWKHYLADGLQPERLDVSALR